MILLERIAKHKDFKTDLFSVKDENGKTQICCIYDFLLGFSSIPKTHPVWKYEVIKAELTSA